MYYTFYKITNNINNMIYYGVHRTTDLGDGYMGSGTILKRAQKKYGSENFSKEILKIFNTPEEMFEMESIIVNEEFIKQKSNYNVKVGGESRVDDFTDTEYFKSGLHATNASKARRLALISNQEAKLLRRQKYADNPTLCKTCNTPHPFEKKRNKFCSHSCSASYNNTGRVVSEAQKLKVSQTLRDKSLLGV